MLILIEESQFSFPSHNSNSLIKLLNLKLPMSLISNFPKEGSCFELKLQRTLKHDY